MNTANTKMSMQHRLKLLTQQRMYAKYAKIASLWTQIVQLKQQMINMFRKTHNKTQYQGLKYMHHIYPHSTNNSINGQPNINKTTNYSTDSSHLDMPHRTLATYTV